MIDPITGERVKVFKKGPAYFVKVEPPSDELIAYPWEKEKYFSILSRKSERSERRQKRASIYLNKVEKLSKKVNESKLERYLEKKIDIQPFISEEVEGVTRLKLVMMGECPRCGESPVSLTYAVRTFEGRTIHVCEDCGRSITKEMKA